MLCLIFILLCASVWNEVGSSIIRFVLVLVFHRISISHKPMETKLERTQCSTQAFTNSICATLQSANQNGREFYSCVCSAYCVLCVYGNVYAASHCKPYKLSLIQWKFVHRMNVCTNAVLYAKYLNMKATS